MPKPVPPPPPQPSIEETREAIRVVRKVMLAAVVVFGAVAATYSNRSFFMDYGRTSASAWALDDVAHLDEAAARAHPGGKVVWIVGASVTRDAFDADWINNRLVDLDSPWRVRTFGFSRGAPGVSAGVAAQLPLRAGDLLVTTVSVSNFREDWVPWSGLASDVLMQTVPPGDMWRIPSASLSDKLEQASAVPPAFWGFLDETMRGITAWTFRALWRLKAPKKTGPRWMTRQRDFAVKHSHLAVTRRDPQGDHSWLGADSLDFSDTQFNMQGLARYRALAEANGVELALFDIPPRQEYMLLFVHPDARQGWDLWRASRPDVVYFPQLPEDHYYDWAHVHGLGRAVWSQHLVRWLDGRPRGTPHPLDWTPPPDAPEPDADSDIWGDTAEPE